MCVYKEGVGGALVSLGKNAGTQRPSVQKRVLLSTHRHCCLLQAAADVTKLYVAVSLASTAAGGVVAVTKSALGLLAAPLFLR